VQPSLSFGARGYPIHSGPGLGQFVKDLVDSRQVIQHERPDEQAGEQGQASSS
jgi:hypothetical protein